MRERKKKTAARELVARSMVKRRIGACLRGWAATGERPLSLSLRAEFDLSQLSKTLRLTGRKGRKPTRVRVVAMFF